MYLCIRPGTARAVLDHGGLGLDNEGGNDSYRSPPRACREYCLQKRGAHQYPTTMKSASEKGNTRAKAFRLFCQTFSSYGRPAEILNLIGSFMNA
jgi:hypothetical protein